MSPCLGCSGIETHPVTLITGETVCNECPAWRLECEARSLLNKSTDQRRQYFDSVKRKSETREAELKAVFMQLWEARK